MPGYIDVSNHPLTLALSENYPAIAREFYTLRTQHVTPKTNNIMGGEVDQKESNGKILYQGQIRSVFTRIANDSCSTLELIDTWGTTEESRIAAEERFLKKRLLTPTLEKILEPYHPYVGTVGFNIMEPGARLSTHYGMISKYIRFHMGIDCDPEAKFLVDDSPPRAWEPGKVWAFDDGLAYHGTQHNGRRPRSILLLDIERSIFQDLKAELF